jgi:hypothetical protein
VDDSLAAYEGVLDIARHGSRPVVLDARECRAPGAAAPKPRAEQALPSRAAACRPVVAVSIATSSQLRLWPHGHRAHELDVVRQSERQAAVGQRARRRQQLAPDGVAALAVEQLAGCRSRLAVATTSAFQPCATPVGSPRSATLATDMPTSRPIRCQRL